MATVTLHTPTAHCGSCAAHISEVMEDVDGVATAELDLDSRITTVDFDPAVVDADRIVSLVTDAGYPVESRTT